MKKRLIISLLVWILVVGLAGALYALPTEVYLKTIGVNPGSSGSMHFSGIGNVNALYGEYDLAIDWDMGSFNYDPISGFCVENALASSSNGLVYELLTSSSAGLNYVYAAYILDQYRAGNISAQAGQLATWEAVLDPNSTNVNSSGDGDFHTNFSNTFTDEANSFLTAMYMGIGGFTGAGYKIARNPVGSEPGLNYQDYVISVPDASIMFLLGPALIGFGLLGSRKSKK